MRPQHALLLLASSAIWGLGFTLNKIAAPHFGPILLVELRLILAGGVLWAWAMWQRQDLQWQRYWPLYLILGITNAAVPFALLAYAVQPLGASLATIINSTSSLFSALLAAVMLGERLTSARLGGLAVGFLGVVVLVGWSPVPLSLKVGLGIAAMLLAALCFAFSNTYVKLKGAEAPVLGVVTGQLLMGAALFVPPSFFAVPTQMPPAEAWWAFVVLTVLATAVANLLFFRLIGEVGPLRASSVGFLVPMFGVLFGVVFLHEPLTWSIGVGMALILLSATLVSRKQ